MGQFVDLTSSDGFVAPAWVAKPEGTPRGAVVVLQEIFGVNSHIRSVADRYAAGLAGRVTSTPIVIPGGQSTWAQYVVEHEDRDGLAAHLRLAEIPTAVYYPVPMHRQEPYADFPQGPGGLPVSDAKSKTVIALPMHPYLAPPVQDRIIEAVCGYNG